MALENRTPSTWRKLAKMSYWSVDPNPSWKLSHQKLVSTANSFDLMSLNTTTAFLLLINYSRISIQSENQDHRCRFHQRYRNLCENPKRNRWFEYRHFGEQCRCELRVS